MFQKSLTPVLLFPGGKLSVYINFSYTNGNKIDDLLGKVICANHCCTRCQLHVLTVLLHPCSIKLNFYSWPPAIYESRRNREGASMPEGVDQGVRCGYHPNIFLVRLRKNPARTSVRMIGR